MKTPARYTKWLNQGLRSFDDFLKSNVPWKQIPPIASYKNDERAKKVCYWCLVYGKCLEHMVIDGDEISAELRKILNWGPYRLVTLECKLCGDKLRSYYGHDFKHCKCGQCYVDGGSWCPRFGGDPKNYIAGAIQFKDQSEV